MNNSDRAHRGLFALHDIARLYMRDIDSWLVIYSCRPHTNADLVHIISVLERYTLLLVKWCDTYLPSCPGYPFMAKDGYRILHQLCSFKTALLAKLKERMAVDSRTEQH